MKLLSERPPSPSRLARRRGDLTGARLETPPRYLTAVLVASGAFVLLAVALEVGAGSAANSQVPGWAEVVVPLAWPQALRVVWWLGVAAAAVAFRWSLHRLGRRQRPIVVGLSAVPFVVFAAGIAAGADWSTWH